MKRKLVKIIIILGLGFWLTRISGLNFKAIGQSIGQKKAISLAGEMKTVYGQKEVIKVEINNESRSKLIIKLTDNENKEIPVEIAENKNEGSDELKINPPPRFKSGRYRLVVTDASGNTVEQDFLWGVLAINPNKSVYYPNETADLAMAVLDEEGKMVCGAKLSLKVTLGS